VRVCVCVCVEGGRGGHPWGSAMVLPPMGIEP
jgi:hypothetical protein